MNRRQSHDISARLTRMNLLVSGAVLLIAAFAFFSYDLFSFRQNLIGNLDAEAQIVGDNTVSALTFNDPQSATATLASLQRSPDVVTAVLTSSDGMVFAHYGSPDQAEVQSHRLSAGENHRVWSSGIHVLVARRTVFQGKSVGIVYISARLTEIGRRARRYFMIATLILLFCMAAASMISSVSRRLIAQPIVALADTALLVSRDRDYSVRAGIRSDSTEIAVLIDAFNTMLVQIQERDAAVTQARNGLEARVEERTVELRAANRELEAFSYTVAHDLRGPLDAIGGIVYLLAQSGGDSVDSDFQFLLDQLKTSTANMGSLIDDLLNFARAATAPVQSAPVDLSAIARDIARDLTLTDQTRKVEFRIADVPEAIADAGLMRIVLDNLLRNAWKYTSQHPEASIEFGAVQANAGNGSSAKRTYFVRDDGAGFDQVHAERLFQPFQRLHGKSEFPGTGIGLATVQRIIARQGGSIWADGKVEEGATFFFNVG